VSARKQRFRKQNRKRRSGIERRPLWSKITWPAIDWPRVFTLTIAIVVMMTGYIAMNWLMDRPIDAVVINSAFQRVSALQLEEALAPHVQTGFLSADLHSIRRQLADIPWVASARVRRHWPGSIEVQIAEQHPAACWGERGLLNIDGELFVEDANHVPVELPRLAGPEGSERRVAAMYFRVQERLEQRGMAATSLRLDNRGAWELQLSNGIRVRLGATAVEHRLNRFFMALDEVIAPRVEQVDYIDMRYTNGFAIGWKDRRPVQVNAVESSEPHV